MKTRSGSIKARRPRISSTSALRKVTLPHDAVSAVTDGLVSIAHAAEFLAVGRTTIYALMDMGKLRYVKIGRARRIPIRSLREYAARNSDGGWDDGGV